MPDTLDLTINVVGIEAALEKFTQFGTEAGKRFWGAFGNGPGGGSTAGGWGGAGQPHGHGYGPGGWRNQGGGRGRLTDAEKQARAEELAHRRSLQYMVQTGRRQQREDARRERAEERAAVAQKRREEKDAAREKARRDKEIWDAAGRLEKSREQQRSYYDRSAGVAGRAASRIATAGVGIGTGLIAAGFHGTTTGIHFANETRLLSLEMASLFDPFMKSLTVAMQKIRQRMSTMTRAEQDSMATRLALIAGARATGLDTAVVSGASSLAGAAIGRYGIAGVAGGAARALPVAAAGYAAFRTMGYLNESFDATDRLKGSMRTGATGEDATALGMTQFAGKTGSDLTREINKYAADLRQRQTNIDSHYESRGYLSRNLNYLNPFSKNPTQTDLSNAQADLNRRMEVLVQMRKAGNDLGMKKPDGTHLIDVSTAGIGGLGSTSEMIQNQIGKLGGGEKAEENDPIVQWLIAIWKAITGLNVSNDEASARIAPAPKG